MVVRFKSDSSGTAKGFSATYTVASAPPVTTTPTTTTKITTAGPTLTTPVQTQTPAPEDSGCGSPGKQSGRKGQINSKNYPQAYPANLRCSWDISVDEGFLVKLHITDLAIVGEPGQCGKDKLTVADSQQSLDIQGCGGFSQEETGIIKSQNWPTNYPANSMCLWTIRVPKGKTIKLTFTHFDVEEAGILFGQCNDNVVVYDGTQPGAKKHGPFCSSKIPAVIESTTNELVIRFFADFFIEAKGFHAHWTTDSTLPTPTEPPVPPNPWDDIKIDWPESCGKPSIPPDVNTRIVNGEPAKAHSWPWQVSMQCFNVLGIYRHEGFQYPTVPTVEFDIALVRLDGEVTPNDYIDFACLPSSEEVLPEGKKCYATGWGDETGNSTAPKVAEALNQVALPVVAYDTCKRMDYWWFQVKTSMICCGYTLPDELKSVCQGDSGGPLVCQDGPSAAWEVHGITSFGPIGCVFDKKPSVFTRSSAYLPWIENIIRKDIYDFTSSGCGGLKDLVGTEGMLESMDHPESYSNRASCKWNIRVPTGKNVYLHFSNFSLEETTLCLNDKVTLSDSIGTLGTYCTSPPRDLVAAGDTLTVSFSSNDKIVDTGFSAIWKAANPADIEAAVGCGGHFTSQQGELRSPSWPNEYPSQTVCTWTISVPSATGIYITFTHFELQAVNLLGQCVDYVEIFDAAGSSKGKFCGSNSPSLTVNGDKATIRFLSNDANQKKGFQGHWTTDPGVFPEEHF
ncbi:hypothetical protein cypCar_00020065 [Cyprinus carpio]|nr:hypothetical protein cypCar_00020065 [Cyprinus carpio]